MSITHKSTVVAVAILATACAQAPRNNYPAYPSYTPPTSEASNAPLSVPHAYELTVTDIDQKPIVGAAIAYTAYKENFEKTTDEQGKALFTVEGRRDASLTYVLAYNSAVSYTVSKDGYNKRFGDMSSTYGSKYSTGSETVKRQVTLIKDSDYFSREFNSSTSTNDKILREQVLKFISYIRLQSLLADSEVKTRGIQTIVFKDKKYLKIVIESTNVYNTLKLNKYEIGVRLFDESVRKILTPLNDHIGNPRAFYGYDIVMIGASKSFSKEYVAPDKTEYRFLMPQDAVRRYKNKDISGQQLIDASIVLMDDERIDLKLQ